MTQRRPHRLLGRCFLVVVVLVTFAACSDDDDDADDDGSTSTTEDAAPTTTPQVVTSVSDSPATENYVGARKDVTNLTCEQDGARWLVAGTITNPSDAPANYRIYTSFLDDASETRGLLQTDIAAVQPLEARDWSGELEPEADDLVCGLRVERTGVDGAPPPTDPPEATP